MYENDRNIGADPAVTGQFSGYENRINTQQTQQENNFGKRPDSGIHDKQEKSGGFLHKLILSVSLGLFFGIFAGLGFYAVQQGTGMMDRENVKEETPETLETGTANIVNGSGSGQAALQNVVYYTHSDVSDVVADVMPAMVSIINSQTETIRYWGHTYQENYEYSGSGIIVSENEKELLIVTNNHVVEDANSLGVTFIDGTQANARIKGTDADMDLAVIAVSLEDLSRETRAAISVATLGDSDELRLGEPVIAIGNALGYGQSVTDGIISALDREMTLPDGSTNIFIQTNAAINEGNSGGALLNINGEVIGINSNKLYGTTVEGMGYAIPISPASQIIADLMERQTRDKVSESERGYMGIQPQEVTAQIASMYKMPEGVFVAEAVEGGAAKEAGIMSGDIIVRFGGEKITSYAELQEVLSYYAAGDSAKVTVMRPENGEYVAHEFELILGEKPSASR